MSARRKKKGRKQISKSAFSFFQYKKSTVTPQVLPLGALGGIKNKSRSVWLQGYQWRTWDGVRWDEVGWDGMEGVFGHGVATLCKYRVYNGYPGTVVINPAQFFFSFFLYSLIPLIILQLFVVYFLYMFSHSTVIFAFQRSHPYSFFPLIVVLYSSADHLQEHFRRNFHSFFFEPWDACPK